LNEADLSANLKRACERAMPHCLALKHAERANRAYPDHSVTWGKFTSWWEVKFYNGRMFESPADQEIMCKRLSQQGVCYYIIFEQRKERRTLIVKPFELGAWQTAPADFKEGFDYDWVAQFIKHEHLYWSGGKSVDV